MDGRDVIAVAPRANAFLEALRESLEKTRPVLPTIHVLDTSIATQPNLRHLTSSVISVPVGDWCEEGALKSLGLRYRDTLVVYAHAMRPFLEQFFTPNRANELIGGFVDDLVRDNMLVSSYYTALAARL